MQPIIHDVAVSIDGFISGPGGDISRFAQGGPVVEDYSARLATYAVAIMGRAFQLERIHPGRGHRGRTC